MNTEMNTQTNMIRACVEWLNDWTQDMPPIMDEYDLATWLESEGCEAVEFFLRTAFRKSQTRQVALEVMRALLWEWYMERRGEALQGLKDAESAVGRLLALPQTAQKTAAWYAEARDLLTGHEFAEVVYGTPAALARVVAGKCGPVIPVACGGVGGADGEDGVGADPCLESRTVYLSPLSPFQWGWRYEDVIRSLFEMEVAKGRVADTLGRIRHPTLPGLAASPDGLICDGPLAGRLVEIKAPKTRVLIGQVPQEYYCQMQLQAEVADVCAVEYVEARFATCEDADPAMVRAKLLDDWPLGPTVPQRMGAVLVLGVPEVPETWVHDYSPIVGVGEAELQTLMTWMPEGGLREGHEVLERSVWRVEDWWATTVPRNRRWWAEVGQPAYEEFWVAVGQARSAGGGGGRVCEIEEA